MTARKFTTRRPASESTARGRDTHKCPSPGCRADVPRSQFACRVDWFRLPKEYRDAIWAGYRGGTSGDHMQAMSDAIGWYAEHPRGLG